MDQSKMTCGKTKEPVNCNVVSDDDLVWFDWMQEA